MKTNVVMDSVDRELMGSNVRQRTKDGFFSCRDVMNAINRFRLSQGKEVAVLGNYLKIEATKEFISELERETQGPVLYKESKKTNGWVHPYLAVDMLLHYNPSFKVRVYQWLWDYLIANRIKSGDSYLEMKGALYEYYENKAKYPGFLMSVAKRIKDALNVQDWNRATKEQLEARDYAHKMICDLTKTLKNARQGVRLGLDAMQEKYPKLVLELEDIV